jgi:hypothetical protein
MTIRERADAALARARDAGVAMPAATAHQGRLRAAMIRDVAALLGLPPEYIVVTDDPAYGGVPGQLITVHDPDDPDNPAAELRFIPELGNTGVGGGAYLLLAPCPACNSGPRGGNPALVGDVPIVSVAILADLSRGLTSWCGDEAPDPEQVPVEFFDDPGHARDCPLR